MSKNDRFFTAAQQPSKIGLPMGRPGGATGIAEQRPNRNVGVPPTPAPDFAQAVTNYSAFTYFTRVGPDQGGSAFILYNGDRAWAEVSLTLQTAGPVTVGKESNLFPITSGRGIQLITNVEQRFTIAKGDRLYVAATSVNSISVMVKAFPWLEQIAGLAGRR